MIFANHARVPGSAASALRELSAAAVAVAALLGGAANATPSLAVYYGSEPPLRELAQFDWVVVDPAQVDASGLAILRSRGAQVFAYVSVGEVRRQAPEAASLDRSWVLGGDESWGTLIVDPANEGYRSFLLARLDALWTAGQRAFFLDTLDSYAKALADPAARAPRARGLLSLMRELHRRHPGVRLLLNRGFDLFPEAASVAAGVVAESLFAGWDAARKEYVPVPERDRAWLADRLREVQRAGLPVAAIDYLPPARRDEARAAARRIAALGFIPWVTDAALDQLGVGSLEVVPRRVLALYDSAEGDLARSGAHRYLALPLEHLGYAVDYRDARGDLPRDVLLGRYAGVVSWFSGDRVRKDDGLFRFFEKQLADGLRFAVFGHPGFASGGDWLERLGLSAVDAPRGAQRISRASALIGFEAPPAVHPRDAIGIAAAAPSVEVHLEVRDTEGRRTTPIVSGSWGGLALDPYPLEYGFDEASRWVLDPFAFLARALDLPALPALDPTTDDGIRLLTAQIDGDGFPMRAEMPGGELAGAQILKKVLLRYRLPTTVAFLEGEFFLAGPNSPLEPIARSIAALPFVELASHSFSHPAHWEGPAGGALGPSDLPIPAYRPTLGREIEGSVEYVTKRLAPAGKPVKMFLWSGDAMPEADAVARVRALGLLNANGGHRPPPVESPSVSMISPLARPVGDELQVYSSAADENALTNYGRGPLYGYLNAVELLRFTGGPRRLKPAGIYYHFWSGAKPGSLDAVARVHAWAKAQPLRPIHLSEYARMVQDFYRAVVLRDLDGGWHFRGLERLRTVRLSAQLGDPDRNASAGLGALTETPQGRYLAFTAAEPVLRLSGGGTRAEAGCDARLPLGKEGRDACR
jgi:hypothetical protein